MSSKDIKIRLTKVEPDRHMITMENLFTTLIKWKDRVENQIVQNDAQLLNSANNQERHLQNLMKFQNVKAKV